MLGAGGPGGAGTRNRPKELGRSSAGLLSTTCPKTKAELWPGVLFCGFCWVRVLGGVFWVFWFGSFVAGAKTSLLLPYQVLVLLPYQVLGATVAIVVCWFVHVQWPQNTSFS